MKILCITGTQLRHMYFLSHIVSNFEISGIILFNRNLVQPTGISGSLFSRECLEFEKKHFSLLKQKEKEYFTEGIVPVDFDKYNIREVNSKAELNSPDTIKWVSDTNSDVVIDYGSLILGDDFLDAMPEWKINLHGGLSPYYKGSATLMWPFYFQQPELAGITYHLLHKKIDGGEILQHFRPAMYPDDSTADVGCRVIKDGTLAGVDLLKKLDKTGSLDKLPQRTTGKLFLEKDYQPSHLKVVYDNMSSGLIKRYLDNKEMFDSRYEFVDQLGLNV